MLRMARTLDEAGDAVHRTGPVKRHDGRDVLDALRPEVGADARHADALKLKDADGLTGGEHLKHGRVLLGNLFNPEIRVLLADELGRALQHRQVSKPEKVHLQQAEFLQRRHRVLTDDRLVVLCQRDVFTDRPLGDDDPGGVG